MKELDRDERLRLLKFVCSFAWTDLKVVDAERALVKRLVKKLDLDAAERSRVEGWLEVPPRPEEIDPTQVPREHRQLFLDAAWEMVEADGRVVPSERDSMELFQKLLQ